MGSGITTILFDMGGTLRGTVKRSRDQRLKFTGEILKILGSEEEPEKLSRLLARRSTAYRKWARETMIELNEADLWTHWLLPDWPVELVSPNAVRLNDLWREATGERMIFPETAEVIKGLFRRGYRLGLVSNTTSSTEAPAALKKYRLTGYFETIVLSAVVGKRKPDPFMLLEAARRMGVSPSECVYVGDTPARDMAAARGAGFRESILIRASGGKGAAYEIPSGMEPDHLITTLPDLFELFPPKPAPQPEKRFNASLSTMWGIGNFQSLADFLEAARRLGFRFAELNHQVDSSMLAELRDLKLPISSIHEPCPADIPASEYKKRDWLISSTNEHFRKEGVRSIQRTLDLAHQLKAKYIVIHAGNVQNDHSDEDAMRDLYIQGKSSSKEFARIKADLIRHRTELEPARFQALKRSIQELLDYAKPLGVALGLENRSHYLEMPNPGELEELLGMAEDAEIGFIFDVGHAGALERLGFIPEQEWLKRFGKRIIGVHIHDMYRLDDHIAPGSGDVDYGEIAPYLPEGALRIIEAQNYNSYAQLETALCVLTETGCIK